MIFDFEIQFKQKAIFNRFIANKDESSTPTHRQNPKLVYGQGHEDCKLCTKSLCRQISRPIAVSHICDILQ